MPLSFFALMIAKAMRFPSVCAGATPPENAVPPAGLFEIKEHSLDFTSSNRDPPAGCSGLRPCSSGFALRLPSVVAPPHPPPSPPAGRGPFATWQGCGQFRPSACTTHTPALSVGHSKGVKCFRGINRAQGRYLFHGHLTPFPFRTVRLFDSLHGGHDLHPQVEWGQGQHRKPQRSAARRASTERVRMLGAAVPLTPRNDPNA